MGVNWKEVDPTDFEKITRDLLTREFNTQIESFAAGPDGGIDLRADNGTTIIQCKRITTNFNSLLSKLREEAKKEDVRKAKRYIVATCIELTPKNKEQILTIFPNIHSTEDILGGGELEELVGKYEEVRNLYPSLWLGDKDAIRREIEESVNNGAIGTSKEELKRIYEVLEYIAVHPQTNDALEILNKHKSLIISGEPGIGKTTLARYIIALYCLHYQYNLVYIDSDISIGNQMFNDDKKQIFFYDDFLGTTFIIGKLIKNENKRIIDFINRVKNTKNKLVVFTTREYIYKQAQYTYAEFDDAKELKKLILCVDNNYQLFKAEIFYKHLRKNNIPLHIIKKLFYNKEFKKWGKNCFLEQILMHECYNPRIIAESISSYDESENQLPFSTYILERLNNPYMLYKHAFITQLSDFERAALIVLGSFHGNVEHSIFHRAWIAYLGKHYNPTASFEQALQILDAVFIISEKKYNGEIYFKYANPGISDFMYTHWQHNPSLFLHLISNACYPQQIFYLINMLKQQDKKLYDLYLPKLLGQAVTIIKNDSQRASTTWFHVQLANELLNTPEKLQYIPLFKQLLDSEETRNFCDIDESVMGYYISLIQVICDVGMSPPSLSILIDSALSNSCSPDVFAIFERLSNLIDDSLIYTPQLPKSAAQWLDNYDSYLSDSDIDFLNEQTAEIERLYISFPDGCYGINFAGCLESIEELISEKQSEENDQNDDDDYSRFHNRSASQSASCCSIGETVLCPEVVYMFERYCDK